MENSPDASFLREMIGAGARRLMELEVGGLIGLPAGERLLAAEVPRGAEVKAGPLTCPHRFGCSSGSVSIRRRASSSVTDARERHHCPVCRRHRTSNRMFPKHSSRWSSRVKAASNSSPAFSGYPER
jgi:ribosomal protein L37AE/L43A